eukprot:3040972-Amphidinium_carterae.1
MFYKFTTHLCNKTEAKHNQHGIALCHNKRSCRGSPVDMSFTMAGLRKDTGLVRTAHSAKTTSCHETIKRSP